MKTISINNGHSTCTVVEAIEAVGIETIMQVVDTDITEKLLYKFDFENDAELIEKYLEIAENDIVIG